MARKWNAIHSGVYVEKTEGVESNPYLPEPEIQFGDGRVFVKRNPSLMLREISELSQDNNLFAFRITSAKPVNPANAPDGFEAEGLRAFENGAQEHFEKRPMKGGTFFWYMKPLLVDGSCLQCHGQQGYKVGDIRGAISVSFDITDTETALHDNMLGIAAFSVVSTGSLLGLLYTAFTFLKKRLAVAHAALDAMARTDPLTGISNRRDLLERFEDEMARARRSSRPLACLMIDVDRFKAINDLYGHAVGDAVLKHLAAIVRETIRPYDIFGRFGGEEFLLILPETDSEAALAISERIRGSIQVELAARSGLADTPVTVSAGLTGMRGVDASIDDIVRRADAALYDAKANGRNRIMTG